MEKEEEEERGGGEVIYKVHSQIKELQWFIICDLKYVNLSSRWNLPMSKVNYTQMVLVMMGIF